MCQEKFPPRISALPIGHALPGREVKIAIARQIAISNSMIAGSEKK